MAPPATAPSTRRPPDGRLWRRDLGKHRPDRTMDEAPPTPPTAAPGATRRHLAPPGTAWHRLAQSGTTTTPRGGAATPRGSANSPPVTRRVSEASTGSGPVVLPTSRRDSAARRSAGNTSAAGVCQPSQGPTGPAVRAPESLRAESRNSTAPAAMKPKLMFMQTMTVSKEASAIRGIPLTSMNA